MSANSSILPEAQTDHHSDRLVLALRSPDLPSDAEGAADVDPIGSVRKVIGGRVVLLAVFDADVLAALVRMGWEVA